MSGAYFSPLDRELRTSFSAHTLGRLVFVPSVGPGYNDEGIRPWNAHNTKSRENGGYYDRMWSRALESGAQFVSITSFNECVNARSPFLFLFPGRSCPASL